MEGVKIIKTMTDHGLSSQSLVFIFVGLGVIAILAMIEIVCNHKQKKLGIIIGSVCVILSCVMVAGVAWNDSAFDSTTYLVEVEDNVSFNAFCEQYDILDSDGTRYVIKEK
jgi:hypothetical protein